MSDCHDDELVDDWDALLDCATVALHLTPTDEELNESRRAIGVLLARAKKYHADAWAWRHSHARLNAENAALRAQVAELKDELAEDDALCLDLVAQNLRLAATYGADADG